MGEGCSRAEEGVSGRLSGRMHCYGQMYTKYTLYTFTKINTYYTIYTVEENIVMP